MLDLRGQQGEAGGRKEKSLSSRNRKNTSESQKGRVVSQSRGRRVPVRAEAEGRGALGWVGSQGPGGKAAGPAAGGAARRARRWAVPHGLAETVREAAGRFSWKPAKTVTLVKIKMSLPSRKARCLPRARELNWHPASQRQHASKIRLTWLQLRIATERDVREIQGRRKSESRILSTAKLLFRDSPQKSSLERGKPDGRPTRPPWVGTGSPTGQGHAAPGHPEGAPGPGAGRGAGRQGGWPTAGAPSAAH